MQTDTSKAGIGFLLYQVDDNDISYVISLGITSLKLKHTLLAPINLEAITLIFALKKLDYFIRGCPMVTLITDCTSIVSTVEKPVSDIKKIYRFQWLFIQLSNISYKMEHLHGEKMYTADALSRASLGKTDFIDEDKVEQDEISNIFVMTNLVEEADNTTEIENLDLSALQQYIVKYKEYLQVI